MKTLPYIVLVIFLLEIGSTLNVPGDFKDDTKAVRMRSLHVNSVVTSRFARTIITSTSFNDASVSKEISFDVELPKKAFISNFSMTIEGKTYVAVVKEKEVAHQVYTDAVRRGYSAGIVKASGRLLERFTVSVNVASRSKVTFTLTYEELLKRILGEYQLLMKIQPKQVVEDFQIEVLIHETQDISFLDAESTFLTNDLKEIVEKSYSGNMGRIFFKPSLDVQRSCPGCTSTVLSGEFTVRYDVDRSHLLGADMQIVNGYFVHFFAPINLPQIPKRVVFVIDVSGSMSGRKIQQTKAAMLRISDDLHPDDFFNIIIFSTSVFAWKPSLIRANNANIEKAKKYIDGLKAAGGTNLNEALLRGVTLILQTRPTNDLQGIGAPMIILLTDGEPTEGVTDTAQIQANVKQAINGHIALYCLGFGQNLDYRLLQTLALENGGVARRIYEDSDAELQLQGFYSEVAQPLLTGIQVSYPQNVVSQLTKNVFQQYYKGSEIVIAGRVTDNDIKEIPSEITAYGVQEQLSFNTSSQAGLQQGYIFGEYIERLWAYLTIQQLLEEQILAKNENKELLRAQALALSLKYNFVTPLSSMVVIKPEDENLRIVAEKPTEAQGSKSHNLNIRQQAKPLMQSFVDGDPHFIVRPPGANVQLCFNVQHEPGVLLRLVDDPVAGITIIGELVGKNKDGSKDASGNTYIGKNLEHLDGLLFRQLRRDYHQESLNGEDIFCWFLSDGFAWLMDMREEDFVVS
ncbi:inter-alpha-trypsin inhibitor heavy chain H3-like [Pelodytes ibericus]